MLTIHKTTDYGQFKLLERNRNIHPKALIESISQKNLLAEHPIICNEEMFVLNGQHRLKAAEFLQVPIYYIISNNFKEDDIGISQTQTPWTMFDYLKFYSKDNEDYKFVDEVIQQHSFPIHLVVSLCNTDNNIFKKFRAGQFCIKKDKKELKKHFKMLYEICQSIKEIHGSISNKTLTIPSKAYQAIWSIIHFDKYNHKTMLEKIKERRDAILDALNFVRVDAIRSCIMEKVYNYKKRINRCPSEE